jgi:hypothetical protein
VGQLFWRPTPSIKNTRRGLIRTEFYATNNEILSGWLIDKGKKNWLGAVEWQAEISETDGMNNVLWTAEVRARKSTKDYQPLVTV